MLEFDDETNDRKGPVIKVVGVGGGGGNAINTMIEGGIGGVDFIVANTDCQVLEANQAAIKVHLGKTLTKGLGAGANPEIGKAAALEDASRVAEALAGADMVFVTAGMGGGTGTGAAPVIAQVARDMGALTVGVVTKPFAFEGSQRKKKATAGIAELAKAVDALIVIPNDRLVTLAGVKMTLKDAFGMVDNVLLNAVRGISDLVMVPGLINVDFADVRTIMTGMGRALMGTGRGTGEKRALEAAQQAISSPLLEDVSINGATGILINITGGPDLTLSEVTEAATLIEEAADPGANIIFGSVIDAHAGDEVRITVIATGFQPSQQEYPMPLPTVSSMSARGGANGRRITSDQMALPMAPGAQPGGFMGQPHPSQSAHAAAPSSFSAAAPYPPASAMGFGVGAQPAAGAVAASYNPGAVRVPGQSGNTASWNPASAGNRYVSAAALPGDPRGRAAQNGAEHLAHMSNDGIAEPDDVAGGGAYGDGFEDELAGSGFGNAGLSSMANAGIAAGLAAGAGASAAAGGFGEWTPPPERPIIRPPVAANPALRGRGAGGMHRMAGSDELGVEESELDKPTYVRRGILPPG
jgi:cell division protein FtsZ